MKSIVLCALLLCALAAQAGAERETTPKAQVLTASFLDHHPDLKHRMRGMKAFRQGQHQEALQAFSEAARYADKAAQAMVGEILWDGAGEVAADRALAYAWMDLAAERGYHTFAVLRERYWQRMSAEEQQRALSEGPALYEAYGDAVAKPRLERLLRAGRRQTTGSRTGHVGSLTLFIPGPAGWTQIDGSTYYAEHYWKPERYFEWQDTIWAAPLQGTVDVGPLQNLPAAPVDAEPH